MKTKTKVIALKQPILAGRNPLRRLHNTMFYRGGYLGIGGFLLGTIGELSHHASEIATHIFSIDFIGPGLAAGLFTLLIGRRLGQHQQRAQELIQRTRESEALFRGIFEQMEDSMYICSPAYKVLMMNPRMIERIGRDVTGEDCYRNIHGMFEPCEWCRMKDVQKGETAVYEVKSRIDDRYYRVTNIPITDKSGQINKMTVFTDITQLMTIQRELEHANKELTLRERELSGLLKASRVVLEQVSFEDTARSIFDILREMIGATSGYVALLSTDGSENEVLFLEAGNKPCTVDPELPMPIRGLREEAYRNIRVVYDNEFLTSNWMKFIPEGHVEMENVLFAPLILDEKTVGVIGIANKPGGFNERDSRIAGAFGDYAAMALKRHHINDQLITSEQKFRYLVDNLAKIAHIFQGTVAGKIESYNENIFETSGYTREELASGGLSWNDLVIKEDRGVYEKAFQTGLKHPEGIYERIYRIRHKQGNIVWIYEKSKIEGLGKAERDSSGRVNLDLLSIDGVFFNITKQKEYDQILFEKERVDMQLQWTSTLVNGIGHDFNNMLSVIKGCADMLGDPKLDEHNKSEMIEDIRKSANQMAQVVRRFVRIYKPMGVLKGEPVDVHGVIRHILKSKHPKLSQEGIQARLVLSDQDTIILSVPGLMEIILNNMLDNAIEATMKRKDEKGGNITIATEHTIITPADTIKHPELEPGEYIKLTIEDDGVGMNPETMRQIYNPYFSTKEQGVQKLMGLSMTEVMSFVKTFGGSIDCESTPGAGTTFTLFLKSASTAQKPSQIVAITDKGSGRLGQKVLLVDDEASILRMIQRMTERKGYEYYTASGGEEALNIFEKHADEIGLIILDRKMPDIEGDDLIDPLREINPRVKIIISSGHSDRPTKDIVSKVNGFLDKPYAMKDFQDTLDKMLQEQED